MSAKLLVLLGAQVSLFAAASALSINPPSKYFGSLITAVSALSPTDHNMMSGSQFKLFSPHFQKSHFQTIYTYIR
jgi:hypothetical protein